MAQKKTIIKFHAVPKFYCPKKSNLYDTNEYQNDPTSKREF